ncbi:MAG: EAL domain-containing protein [Pseudoxanthomonas sp.]
MADDGLAVAAPQATILIVDDEPINCQVLEALLTDEGYLTISVHSGPDALDSVRNWTPDLILLDAMMPVMDGYEVAEILQDDPVTSNIPIIMVTGLVGQASKVHSLKLGVSEYLTKPVDRAELCVRISGLLRVKEKVDQLQSQTELLAEQVLEVNKEIGLFSAAMDSTPDIVVVVDRKTMRYVQVNTAAVQQFGYSRQELLGMGPEHVMEMTREQLESIYDRLIAGEDDGLPVEAWIRSREAIRTRYEIRRHAISNGRDWTIVMVARDITDRAVSDEKLHRLAYYDALTDLPNQASFNDHLAHAIQHADAWELQLVLMHVDLDRFREAHEALGRAVGDKILRQVAQRLTACLYTRDTVARLAGDEFAVIALTARNPQLAVKIADKVLKTLRAPFEVEGNTIHLTASVGMSLYPNDTQDPAALSRNAALAMHDAKQSGRDKARFYTADLNVRAQNKKDLEEALRGALERDEFVLHYQPKVCLLTGVWTGVEALLRWNRPGHGMVMPGAFIDSLEESGLIVKVGTWALRAACDQLAQWRHTALASLPIAVNVSALQLVPQDLPAPDAAGGHASPGPTASLIPMPIRSALGDYMQALMIPEGLLEIEITESVMMTRAETSFGMLQELKGMGIRVSLDDFGTGYSSLAYLARFPLDAVKIDGSFIAGISSDTHHASITQAIIGMAHQLGIKVVAECVETSAQLAFLRSKGCDEAQGYYFSRPLSSLDLENLWVSSNGIFDQVNVGAP